MVDTRLAGKWLKPQPGEAYTIADKGTHAIETVKAPDGSEGSRLIVGVKESPQRLILNSTSLKALQKAWGYDSDKWAGKKVRAVAVQMTVRGTLQDVVVLQPFAK